MPPNGIRGPLHEAAISKTLIPETNIDFGPSICDTYVISVETPTGKFRRRVYLSLHSAEKAVVRSEQNGHPAKLILCRLVPVGGGPNGNL